MSHEREDAPPAAPEPDAADFEAPAKGSADELLDADAHDPLDPMRHSAAHVMAEAVMDLFPGTKLGIGPAIEGGFYYDFDLARPLTPEDLGAIEARMAASVAADHPFVRREWDPDEGRAFLDAAGQPYKVEILDDLRTAAEAHGEPPPTVSTYEHGPFIDLCRGPHVASTGLIGPFKLLSVAGAYWRGREDRPMLQRIYGTVWATQEELDLYLWRREEARRRDHRRLGVALDLFSFHDISPGSAFWHPKGQRLWRTLEDAMRELQRRYGYEEVVHAHPRPSAALGAVGPLGPLRDEHVPPRERGPGLRPQAHELPGVHVHLPQPGALLPRPAAALRRVRPAASQRALGRPPRPHAGPPLRPGRRPRLRPPGPAGRRAPRRSSR